MVDADERAALREHLAGVLASECGSSQLRKMLEQPNPGADLAAKLAELGWLGVLAPEDLGGMGLGMAVLGDTYIELGRVLAPVAMLPTQLFVDALLHSGSKALAATYVPAIAAGEMLASVSPVDREPGLVAVREGDSVVLSGRADYLLDGAAAGVLLLSARDAQGQWQWLVVTPEADGVAVVLNKTVDPTRHFASVAVDGLSLPADRLLASDGEALRQHLIDHAALALACDGVGGAARILDITVEYMKTRTQFDKPIGSFQALKHRAATLKVKLEATTEVVKAAIDHVAAGDHPSYWASMAKFMACDAYNFTAGDAVQLHGGIGFTWEHDCHFFLKRAKLNQLLYGDSRWHQDRSLAHKPTL